MKIEPLGSVVIDERVYPISKLWLEKEKIQVLVMVGADDPRVIRDLDYAVYGNDGSLIWIGAFKDDLPDLPSVPWCDLTLHLGIDRDRRSETWLAKHRGT